MSRKGWTLLLTLESQLFLDPAHLVGVVVAGQLGVRLLDVVAKHASTVLLIACATSVRWRICFEIGFERCVELGLLGGELPQHRLRLGALVIAHRAVTKLGGELLDLIVDRKHWTLLG